MALFSAAAILADEKEERVIELDFFDLPEGQDIPTITIEISNRTREAVRKAADRHSNVLIQYSKGRPVGKLVNRPDEYCREVLDAAYLDSEGLVDNPSKEVILKLLKREPRLAKELASKLMETFEHSDLYQDEEDEKN
jgi:hypothetical protein